MKNKNLVKYTLDQIIDNPYLLLEKFEHYYYGPYTHTINYFYKIDKEYVYIVIKNLHKEKRENEIIFNKIYIPILKKWFDCKNVQLF